MRKYKQYKNQSQSRNKKINTQSLKIFLRNLLKKEIKKNAKSLIF